MEPMARKELIRSKVEAVVTGVGLEGLDGTTVWGEAGLDSLGMVEVRNGVVRAFENTVPLGATALFDYPTLNGLVQHIEATLCPPSEVGGEGPSAAALLSASREEVAVVGMACRFPGASDGPKAFWRMLVGGGDGSMEIPIMRMDWRPHYDPREVTGKTYTNRGAFIEDVMLFDHAAFHITAAEAALMHPQQRIALEEVHVALQQAGLRTGAEGEGLPVATFAAATGPSDSTSFGDPDSVGSPYSATGVAACISANRLAFVFGLAGPSLTVDTACSSSLVAIDVPRLISYFFCAILFSFFSLRLHFS